jgi:hypothetical protein
MRLARHRVVRPRRIEAGWFIGLSLLARFYDIAVSGLVFERLGNRGFFWAETPVTKMLKYKT